MDCSLPGSSVHGIFQARILEWAAISFSRGSSQPRDQTQVSRIVGRCFYCLSHQGSPIYNFNFLQKEQRLIEFVCFYKIPCLTGKQAVCLCALLTGRKAVGLWGLVSQVTFIMNPLAFSPIFSEGKHASLLSEAPTFSLSSDHLGTISPFFLLKEERSRLSSPELWHPEFSQHYPVGNNLLQFIESYKYLNGIFLYIFIHCLNALEWSGFEISFFTDLSTHRCVWKYISCWTT